MSAKRRAPKTLRGRYDRSKSPEERQREQYDRLLDATRDLLTEHGWGKVTVDMILKLSTLSRATFYAHFKDIEDVLNHAYVRASERAVRIVTGEAVDPAERLRQGLFSFLELVRSNPRWARVMLEGGRGAPAQVVALQEAAYERWIEQILARSPEEIAQGLMFRESLAPGAGMIFLFDTPEPRSFWMKNCHFPLDMVFTLRDGTVVDVLEGVPPCAADPCPSYPSRAPADTVIELTAGEAKRHRIVTGARLSFLSVPER